MNKKKIIKWGAGVTHTNNNNSLRKKVKPKLWFVLVWLGLFSLFNGISNCELFKAQTILEEEQLWYYLINIWWE